jgi:hypothetical protein
MESTLSLKLSDLQAKLGTFLGWGRGAAFQETAWSTSQQAVIDDCTQSGLRRFYWPTPADGQQTSYDWSFLKPTSTADFPQGAQYVPLPDDFGGFEDQITLLTTNSTAQPWRVEWRNEGELRRMYSVTPVMTGPPMYAATQPLKGTTPTQGQRFQLFLFPAADQDYTLQFQYYIAPDYLTGATPYSYGGAQHTETILESCLAIAEERLDDASGIHAQAFASRLSASIAMDRRLKPQKIGPNLDRSDRQGWERRDVHYYAPAATYNGGGFG